MPDIKKTGLEANVKESQQELTNCTILLLAMKARAMRRVAAIKAELKAREQQATSSENADNVENIENIENVIRS